MSNTALENHLAELGSATLAATNQQDINAIAEKIQCFSASNKYQVSQPVIGTLTLICALAAPILFVLEAKRALFVDSSLILLTAAAALILSIIYFARRRKVKSIGNEIFYKSVAIANGLWQEYQFDGRQMWQELRKQFGFFKCGDEGQNIVSLYHGKTEDDKDFRLFKFKYVEVQEEEDEDSDGNKTRRTTRTTHHKYGILTELPSFKGIVINASNRHKEKWDSASRAFNKRFKIRCANPVEAAKFFTPSTVLKFEEEFSGIKSLDVHENNLACIGLQREVLPDSSKAPKLKNAENFVSMLLSPPQLTELNTAKSLISHIHLKNHHSPLEN